ncbi:MAG: hypothetical protein JSV33_11545 [bacterium]|nr:MAG: hypothetical protein JSV33_11545 [bacterium]
MIKRYKYLVLIFSLFLLIFFISCDVGNKDQQKIKTAEKNEWHDLTIWNIEPDSALDVLCLLNSLSGDSFYMRFYEDDFQYLKKQFTPETEKAIASLTDKVRIKNKKIISAQLTLYFSSVNPTTIEDLLYFLRNSDEIETKMKKTTYYDKSDMKLFKDIIPELTIIFSFLKEIGFFNYWKENKLPNINKKIRELENYAKKYNIIAEIESMLGHPIKSDTLDVKLLYYTKPHGIRITGTRFINAVDWPFEILVRTAIHELMHPPYDFENDKELREALLQLKNDEFIMDKVINHNPMFGYNTFEGFIEENVVQAMDQIITEKFDIHREPHKRWLENDDGMHVFAPALYKILKEDYSTSKEKIRDILIKEILTGKLKPGNIQSVYNEFYSNYKN